MIRMLALLSLEILFASCAFAEVTSVEPIGDAGRYLGFVCQADGQQIELRFSTAGRLVATGLDQQGNSLRFTGLQFAPSSGAGLGEGSFINVKLEEGVPWVDFRLELDAFDSEAWSESVGEVPFHFLICSMPSARLWHQRGWMHPTPKEDPFTLFHDTHINDPEVASSWNHNWGFVTPIGGMPHPVIGLWDSDSQLYVGFDFMKARVFDHTERYVACGYCWEFGEEGQFITLAYPYQGYRYGILTWPETPAVIQSQFALRVFTDMDELDDPNARLVNLWMQLYREAFEPVPITPDMDWISEGRRFSDFPAVPPPLFKSGAEKPFGNDETQQIAGWTWHRSERVLGAKLRGEMGQLEAGRAELAWALEHAITGTLPNGEKTLFWNKPVLGAWTPEWGGEEVKTLHNANGWAAGLALLEYYRYDNATDYLPAIDGVFNWTKGLLWTRNGFADVPSSPFAIGSTLPAAFCLEYYQTFKNDPERSANAELALKIARNVTYRYLQLWLQDSDPYDWLDPRYLAEPNGGRDWAAAACANELMWNIDELTQVYVYTGDPTLALLLAGMLQRWPLLYMERQLPNIRHYGSLMTERYGLFPGSPQPLGTRAPYGWGEVLPANTPVGQAKVCVACGPKAAFLSGYGRQYTRAEEYAASPEGALRFRLNTTLSGEFEVTLYYPFADIATKQVTVERDGQRLTPELRKPKDRVDMLNIVGLRRDDLVMVGPQEGLTPGTTEIALAGAGYEALQPIEEWASFLSLGELMPLSADWLDNGGFASLVPGRQYYYGVPFLVTALPEGQPLGAQGHPMAQVSDESNLALLVAGDERELSVSVTLADGSTLQPTGELALAWQAWPPCMTQRAYLAWFDLPAGAKVTQLGVEKGWLLGVTALTPPPAVATEIAKALEVGRKRKVTDDAARASAERVKALLAEVPDGRIALLPMPSGAASTLLDAFERAGMLSKLHGLTADDLLEANFFNPKRFPLAIYAGREDYPRSIRAQDDGLNALVNYVKTGGTIICASTYPMPFAWGVEYGKGTLAYQGDKLGLPLGISFEAPPAGEKLSFALAADQQVITNLPRTWAFPTEGDLRLRALNPDGLPAFARYTPLVSVVSDTGQQLGDAAGLIEFEGEGWSGRILYLWMRLWNTPPESLQIIEDTLRFIAAEAVE